MTQRWRNWAVGLTVIGVAALILALPMVASAQQNTLEAKKVAAGPMVDGTMKPFWQQATPLAVKLSGGRNLPGGSTEVTLRAVYDNEKIYSWPNGTTPPRASGGSPTRSRRMEAGNNWRTRTTRAATTISITRTSSP